MLPIANFVGFLLLYLLTFVIVFFTFPAILTGHWLLSMNQCTGRALVTSLFQQCPGAIHNYMTGLAQGALIPCDFLDAFILD